ncbi:hypothetical protein ALC57_02268 [Trachymyrmex cornetzi]|uniref:Uncharacterized protein n=1 Tax=Trachymyrmex cornetzi TaxID=471704 RepID=A0A195EIX9_9HYME|nr:hypothetical protein ALC57_02268 [Trachymyrmex cornetzi]
MFTTASTSKLKLESVLRRWGRQHWYAANIRIDRAVFSVSKQLTLHERLRRVNY